MIWSPVSSCDPRVLALADRHYSRITPGSRKATGPGREVVLLHETGLALFVAKHQLPPKGPRVFRCSICRNESEERGSWIVETGYIAACLEWVMRYGALPKERMRTEVDTRKVRSPNPGACFLIAGWKRIDGPPSAKVRRPWLRYFEAPPIRVVTFADAICVEYAR